MKRVPVSLGGNIHFKTGEMHSLQLAGFITMLSCSSVTKNNTKYMIQCGLREMTCLSSHFRTQNHSVTGTGPGKAGGMATHSGEGCYLREVGEGRTL